ncbi:5407_t:CDS:2 [Ambispora gerdemannii]|uniref:5407_t:CDS:1 n=1 Tax=Ambispora gerdemannii TaxID=144530 RepID=A0A9N9G0S0_9GLOM|nr:5407_t:CDS:2 [Ambispora gerdemannii]
METSEETVNTSEEEDNDVVSMLLKVLDFAASIGAAVLILQNTTYKNTTGAVRNRKHYCSRNFFPKGSKELQNYY